MRLRFNLICFVHFVGGQTGKWAADAEAKTLWKDLAATTEVLSRER